MVTIQNRIRLFFVLVVTIALISDVSDSVKYHKMIGSVSCVGILGRMVLELCAVFVEGKVV